MVSSLYLHIPFCVRKCLYCSFASWAGHGELHGLYVDAIISELESTALRQRSKEKLKTIFFGGGTPTVIGASGLVKILDRCRELFGLEQLAEVSMEVNPGTVDEHVFDVLLGAGVNRISIGVQSFLENELVLLGRCHTAEEAVAAVRQARTAGFSNLSLDLMYGLPGQKADDWQRTLETGLSLGPDHLSMYQLTIEENTPFADMLDRGELLLPEEEEILAMDELNLTLCGRNGLELYEISNFARPGFMCRHNINYWQNNDYLAAGAGAVSCLLGLRERRCENPREYIDRVAAGESVIVESEQLGREESFRETVIMGLRMTDGVSLKVLGRRFGIDLVSYYGDILNRLLADGLVELSGGRLRITASGRLLSNSILAELV